MSAPERPPIRADPPTISLDELEWRRQEGYEFDVFRKIPESHTVCPNCGKQNPDSEALCAKEYRDVTQDVVLECPFCGCRIHIVLKCVVRVTKDPFMERLEESDRRWRK